MLGTASKKQRESIMNDLKAQKIKLELKHLKYGGKKTLRKLNLARKKLGLVETAATQRNLPYLRQKFTTQSPRHLRWLNRRVKRKLAAKYITSLSSVTSTPITSLKDIMQEFLSFYKNLYTSSQPSVSSINFFLMAFNFTTKLKEVHKQLLDHPVTAVELKGVLAGMKNNKATGRDGFPVEFYKQFSPLLLDHMVTIFNFVLSQGSIPGTWQEAHIIVLPKLGKDPKLVGAYRPISLLNHDAKVFTSVLAKCLNTFLSEYVPADQSGFIPTRQITDNICRALNVINYCKVNNVWAFILGLDTEKAFGNHISAGSVAGNGLWSKFS